MKEKLHPFHVGILIYMIQTGVVIFSLPRLLAQSFGYNGWIVVIIMACAVTVNIWLISLVYRLGGGRSVFEILEQSFPKLVLSPGYIGLAAIWGLTGCMVGKKYIIIFQMLAYPTTHPMLFKLLIDILAFSLAIQSIYNITKASTVFFWITMWMMGLLLFFFKDFEWVRLTPFFLQGGSGGFREGLDAYSALLGYELALLLFPFAERGKRFMKAVYAGHFLTVATYLPVCFICFGFFSFEQLTKMKFPLLDLLSLIQLPFIERLDNLLFGFFLFTSLITIVMYIWSSKEALRRLLPRINNKWLVLGIIAAIFGVSWLPQTLDRVEKWLSYLCYIETAVAFGLPLLLIGILLIQRSAASRA